MLFLYVLYPTVYYGEADKVKHERQFLEHKNVIRRETFDEYLKLLDAGDFEHIKMLVPEKYWKSGHQGQSDTAKEEGASVSK